MLSRFLENLRMTDDVSRLFGEVIIDTTQNANSALVRAVRRFVSDAPVMNINGVSSDENTIGVRVYEPFEITRFVKIISSASYNENSLSTVRALLRNAKIVEINEAQSHLAERALNAWRHGANNSLPQLHEVIAAIVPGRSVITQAESLIC
ncbi:hypothetical protein DICVIV_03291 [Dictyocaulus viviparus]|uniref:Uncharacterized protein n=1 Tax=Dictyocaulus viviparus TaxID=29172 RepID=A0A0D8Y2X2_DICVI|nr:hypothetical protein DICVIV_03291 [Dictyocaulus viviparus]